MPGTNRGPEVVRPYPHVPIIQQFFFSFVQALGESHRYDSMAQYYKLIINNLNSEKELFSLIAEGDEQAFNELYQRLFPDFAAYIFQIVKSQDAVHEILQESLVRFWLNRDKLPEIEYPKTWLSRIVVNECYRYLKKHGLRQRLLEQIDKQQIADNDRLNQTDLNVAYRETQKIIQQTVAGLTLRQRTVYRMSREDGLKLREIATKLGVSQDYIKKTLMAALRIIRQALVKAGRFIIF